MVTPYRGWQLAGINSVYAGEPVTLTYTPGAMPSSCPASQQDFRGANNYRPNVDRRPSTPRGSATDHQLVQQATPS